MKLFTLLLVKQTLIAALLLTGCNSRQNDSQQFEALFDELPQWAIDQCEGSRFDNDKGELQEMAGPVSRGRCLIGAAFRYYDGVMAFRLIPEHCIEEEPQTGECSHWLYVIESESPVDGHSLLNYDQCIHDSGLPRYQASLDDSGNFLFDASQEACSAAKKCSEMLGFDDLVPFEWSETYGCYQRTQRNWQGDTHTLLGVTTFGILPAPLASPPAASPPAVFGNN